jgi:sulfite oxidase
VPPQATAETVDWSRAPMLGDLPVTSVLCTPDDGAELPAGPTEFRGYAVAGGNRGIRCVELSADAGATWTLAQLGSAGEWAWTVWRTSLHLKPGPHRIVVRATDAAGETQPQDLRAVWNFRGYVNNAWHAISTRAVERAVSIPQ